MEDSPRKGARLERFSVAKRRVVAVVGALCLATATTVACERTTERAPEPVPAPASELSSSEPEIIYRVPSDEEVEQAPSPDAFSNSEAG